MNDAVTPLHNPLLALPLSVIDPGASTTRDEGERRLPLLRAALFQLQREHKTLCAEGGVGSLVAALTPSVRVHASMHASLFKPDSSWKPRVCLIAPSAQVMAPAEADVMTVEERVQCIPVADDPHGCVAFPNWPLHAPRRLVAHFDARRAGGVGAAATMQMERTGLDRVTMRVSSANGERRVLSGTVASQVIEKLFERSWSSVLQTEAPAPALPGELPQVLMDEVADFWQRHVRAHVVASVCAPDDTTRPLGFNAMRARLEGQQHKRAVVRCTLHRSSVSCACALWQRVPVHVRHPTERWVGSEVEMTLSMCGRALNPSSRECPFHGASTPNVPLLPAVCCHGTVAGMQCSHQTQNRRTHTGIQQYDMRLSGLNVLHAQVLIASCMRSADAVAPLLGKAPHEQIVETCTKVAAQARVKLDAVTRERAISGKLLSEAELQQRDMKAHDLLVEGNIKQYERPSTREVVLAKIATDGSAAVLTADQGSELVSTHLGLFDTTRPAPRKRRKNA